MVVPRSCHQCNVHPAMMSLSFHPKTMAGAIIICKYKTLFCDNNDDGKASIVDTNSYQMYTGHIGINQILPIHKVWYSLFTKWWNRRDKNLKLGKKYDMMRQNSFASNETSLVVAFVRCQPTIIISFLPHPVLSQLHLSVLADCFLCCFSRYWWWICLLVCWRFHRGRLSLVSPAVPTSISPLNRNP